MQVLQRPCRRLSAFQHAARIGDVISLCSGDSVLFCHTLGEPALGQSLRKHILRQGEPQARISLVSQICPAILVKQWMVPLKEQNRDAPRDHAAIQQNSGVWVF